MANAGLSIRRWTEAEDEILRRLYPRGSRQDIRAALPGRSQKAIGYRAAELGLKCESRPKPSIVLAPVIEREGVRGKVCLTCLEWKPLDKFGPNKAPGVGNCKPRCMLCESRTNYAKYPEVFKRGSNRYRRDNPETLYLGSMRGRALKMGAPVELITVEEIRGLRELYGGLCAYCRKRSGDTLDHLQPLSRGGAHSIANLLPACFRCNHSKKDKTFAEWFESDVPHNPFRKNAKE